ncbi:MAG: DUF2442 domain-containing protein [Candidatus Latescibacteria bacterium]|nr:DUF2442 domain-containing protein [Candidatus Latescibacterota bacterium]
MNHLLVNVTGFEIVEPYTLRITFGDGEERTINFEPVLHGHYYGPLRNLSLFNQVRLDPEIHTLVWPTDADFDPATLYNWHKGEGAELAKRTAHFQSTNIETPISGSR